MSATAAGVLPGDFGPYRFLGVLGSGALATVYLAEDSRSGARLVVKVGPSLDSSATERFRVEAEALGRLQHPNIPRLADAGSLPDGRPYLATQWMEGSSLDQLLAAGERLRLTDAMFLARSLARALGHAHQHHILHLDVKPANILIPKYGETHRFDRAMLIDFSVLGKLQRETGTTLAGALVGTPYYMSPEQVRGEALTPAADLFSLGVVLYQILSGRLPFEGANPSEMFFALLSKDPDPLGPAVPFDFAQVVMRCLAKDPGRRPASTDEVEGAIDKLLQSTPPDTVLARPVAQPAVSTAHPAGEATRLYVPAARGIPAPPQPVPSRRRASWALAAMVGLAVLAVTLFSTLWIKKSATPPHAASAESGLIALGALLAAAGVAAGIAMQRFLAGRREHTVGEVSAMLTGASSRKALSMTLSLQVDDLMKKCRLMDEKFLGLTMALMVKEYDSACAFDERQKALMNAIAILEKLGPKLSPWYVRHDKLVATGVSLVGIISGLATAAESVVKMVTAK